MDESFITDELTARIGVATEPCDVTLTAELVRRVRETLADGPAPASDDVPPAVMFALEASAPLTRLFGLPESSLVSGDEWEWRRRLRAGETLRAVSRLVDANEHFGGRLGHALFLRHEWLLSEPSGEPVAFARRSIAYYVGADARPPEAHPPLDAAPPPPAMLPAAVAPRTAREGDPLTPIMQTPTLSQVVRYCGTAWAFTPIFYDTEAARAAGLPHTIIPGPLKLAFLSEFVRAWAGPEAELVSVRAAHRRPDAPNRPMLVCGVVTRAEDTPEGRRLECEVWIENEFGQRSVAGAAVVRL